MGIPSIPPYKRSARPDRTPNQRQQECADLAAIIGFMPSQQVLYLKQCLKNRNYESEHAPALKRLREIIEAMPKTYDQDGKGDEAIVSLHYFSPSSDWWITEKDAGSPDDEPDEFQIQAFGYARLNGDNQNAELGYINIRELCATKWVELDFHFEPRPLRIVKERLEQQR